MSMDEKRDSFTFQRYYFEAISTLKSKEKLELYDAICTYVFEEKDAILNSKKAESCFILIKQLLDEEWKRSDIASKGWSTRKSAHPHVTNEMKVSSSMGSKSDDNEPIDELTVRRTSRTCRKVQSRRNLTSSPTLLMAINPCWNPCESSHRCVQELKSL